MGIKAKDISFLAVCKVQKCAFLLEIHLKFLLSQDLISGKVFSIGSRGSSQAVPYLLAFSYIKLAD